MIKFLAAASVALAITSCHSAPPPPPTPREATSVSASFGKTWDAAIDVFGERDLSIRTIDRSSGLLIPSDYLFPDTERRSQYANCGKAFGNDILPTVAHFNVIVRGDSSRATVRVRAFYDHSKSVRLSGDVQRDVGSCTSTGQFETELESAIAARAEGRQSILVQQATAQSSCARRDAAEVAGDNIEVDVFRAKGAGVCEAHHCKLRNAAGTTSKDRAIQRCREEAAAKID